MGKVRKGRKVNKALCKKGFCREEDGGHICYSPFQKICNIVLDKFCMLC